MCTPNRKPLTANRQSFRVGRPMVSGLIRPMRPPALLVACLMAATLPAAENPKVEMAGYLIVPTESVPDSYNAGFSIYAAAWPLLKQYPGHRFQTGLFGTWMHPQYPKGAQPKDLYNDIEGGPTRTSRPRRRSSSWVASA
jgi:hypothetical protein